MASLVAEIAAASREQAQGIDQVNKAVSEMDKVIQQTAANAEESAAAAEELTAQAEQLKRYVGDLDTLIGGRCVERQGPRASGKRSCRREAANGKGKINSNRIIRKGPRPQGRKARRGDPVWQGRFQGFLRKERGAWKAPGTTVTSHDTGTA